MNALDVIDWQIAYNAARAGESRELRVRELRELRAAIVELQEAKAAYNKAPDSNSYHAGLRLSCALTKLGCA